MLYIPDYLLQTKVVVLIKEYVYNSCTHTHTRTHTNTHTYTCVHPHKCRRQVAVLRLMPSFLPPRVSGDGDAGGGVVLQ